MYLRQFDTVSQARVGLKDYFEFYNYERLHQSLDYHTPAQVYLDNNSSVNPLLYQPNSILILRYSGLDIGEYLTNRICVITTNARLIAKFTNVITICKI